MKECLNTSVILHIPHSSKLIPDKHLACFLGDVEMELLHMTDAYVDELFDLPGEKLIFPVSRLVCDPERFRDDSLEEMAKLGMGAVYTHGHDLKPLRHLELGERENILREYYDPHHAKLNALAAECMERFGHCLILDCHSFSPIPLPYEPDQNPDRPDICIGTDPFHTPQELADTLANSFRSLGYSVRLNSPYAGTMVPSLYYRCEPRLYSVMIELNRGLYMDSNGEKTSGFEKLKEDIRIAIASVGLK